MSKIDVNNPLHPWNHEGEVWLTNLLYQNGNISRSTADEFLGVFANGTIIMVSGPVQFSNSREMMRLLDIAAGQTLVSSNTMNVYTVKHLKKLPIFCILFSSLGFSEKGFQCQE